MRLMRTAAGRRRDVAALGAVWVCMLTWSPCALALNPALDVSQYAHTSWKIRDGFSKGTIDAIAQTPDGYLWLGTEFGLLRFDGVRNVVWQPPAGETLPSTWVRSLLVGRDGTLWIGTLKGLASWKDGKLAQYPRIGGMSVDTLLEDRQGTVWAAGFDVPDGKLCAIDRGTGATRCHGEDHTLGTYVGSLYEDASGNLWAGAETGLWRWHPGPPKSFPGLEGLNIADAIIEGDNHALIIASRAGLRQLVEGKVQEYAIPGGRSLRPNLLLRDRDGGLWIAALGEGLSHVHEGRTDVFAQSDGLSSDQVYRLFEDREGNIWVVTADGLDRFREFAVSTISVKQGLSSNAVGSVAAASDGSVWLGTTRGLNRWEDGRIEVHREVPNVASLVHDNRGRFWVSTSRQAGYLEHGRFVPVSGVPDGNIRSMAVDRRGDLWIANQTVGLFRVHTERKRGVESIPWTGLGHKDFASVVIADPTRGGLWLGFYQGGMAYFADGRILESYGPADGLGGGVVNDFHIDPDGTLWAATEGGLSRLKDGRIATLTNRNGLPCDTVHWVVEDDAHSFWLYAACGLVRIARAELEAWAAVSDDTKRAVRTIQAVVFDASDGVRSHAAAGGYRPLVAKSADGKLWFVPWDGISVIDPLHLPVNTLLPPVHIEQITADRTTYEVTSIAGGPIRLPPLIRDLQIEYTALSLVAPEKMRFRYRLEGYDRDWQDAGTRRQAFYTKLPPNNYRFRVIASNNSGVWNEAGTAIEFSIAPAYYQTGWFLTLSAGVVVGLVWVAHRLRLRIVERHEREISALNERLMKAQEQERIRIAGELHDGVMQQMLAVTMMLGTAKRRIPDGLDAKATIDKAQEKLIQVGTDIRQISHDLHPPVLQEAGLPQAVQGYCEEFSASSGIPVSCDADEVARELSRGAALALFRVVQEALGNAAKHAHATRITVRLTRSDGTVSLLVSDDGVGFDPSRLGMSGGLGLITMRERASQLNGTFEFASAPGHGTTIRVVIPFR
jgi:signal transduction histidine kinase/ligand-binding sensor domain-containing protein